MERGERGPNRPVFPLRGAVVGFGNVALQAHLPMWREDGRFQIDAVVEPDPDRAKLASQSLPGVPVYPEMGSLFRHHRLDFVDICTPPRFHAEQVVAACEQGLHVFCEKPLVTALQDLTKIRYTASAARRVVFTVNNWRHAPIWTKAFELLRKEEIGALRSVELSVLRPPQSGGGATPWRRCSEVAGGGILLDHGWHHLYLIRSAVGETPLSVSATMKYCPADPRLEETVDLTLRFREAVARLHLTWEAACRRNHGVFRGDRGELSMEDDHLVLRAAGSPGVFRYPFAEALSCSSHHLEWMRPVAGGFLREILAPDARGANLEEASWCALVIHLAYESQKQGSRPVEVPVGPAFPRAPSSPPEPESRVDGHERIQRSGKG